MEDDKLIKHSASMKEYLDQVARERTSMSLTLRRTKRPSIFSVRKNQSGPGSKQRSPSLEKEFSAFLQPCCAIQIIQNNDFKQISEMALGIESCINTNQRMLDQLIASEEFAIELVSALTSEEILETNKIPIFQIISSMFAASNIISEYYIDNGLSFSLLELLTSGSETLASASVTLIRHLSGTAYAKDSFICMGMHDILIEMVLSSQDVNKIEECCTTICAIFQNIDEADSSVLSDVIEKLSPLLKLEEANSVRAIITALVYITNQQPALIYKLYESDTYRIILDLLSNEVCCGSCLILLGNMCNAHTTNIMKLVEAGLFDRLQGIVATEHAAGAFSVVSCLIGALPTIVLPFAHTLILPALESIATCGFEAKKEITFFIATYVLFVPAPELQPLINEEVLEVIIEMLGCSVPIVIQRCLDAIQRAALSLETQFLDISESSFHDLIDSLERLSNSRPSSVQSLASHILAKLEAEVTE